MARLEFLRLAERELNEAGQYYDREEPGLGASFLQEVHRCLESIEASPESGAILRGSVRRRLLRRFRTPFCTGLPPAASGSSPSMNLTRRPTYWIGRE